MERRLNLLEETIEHLGMGAKSVTAFSTSSTFIITRAANSKDQYVVTEEEAGFAKTKTHKLDHYFVDVFGIEARY